MRPAGVSALSHLRTSHDVSLAMMMKEQVAAAAATDDGRRSVEIQTLRQTNQRLEDRLRADAAYAEQRFASFKRAAMAQSVKAQTRKSEERSKLEAKIDVLTIASSDLLIAMSTDHASEMQGLEASVCVLKSNLDDAKHQALAHAACGASEHGAELLQTLQCTNDRLEDQLEAHAADVERLLAVRQGEMRIKHEAEMKDLEDSVHELKANLTDASQLALVSATSEYDAEHAVVVAALHAQYADALSELQGTYEISIGSYALEVESLEASVHELTAGELTGDESAHDATRTHDAAIAALHSQHTDSLSQLHATHAETLAQTVTMLSDEHREALESAELVAVATQARLDAVVAVYKGAPRTEAEASSAWPTTPAKPRLMTPDAGPEAVVGDDDGESALSPPGTPAKDAAHGWCQQQDGLPQFEPLPPPAFVTTLASRVAQHSVDDAVRRVGMCEWLRRTAVRERRVELDTATAVLRMELAEKNWQIQELMVECSEAHDTTGLARAQLLEAQKLAVPTTRVESAVIAVVGTSIRATNKDDAQRWLAAFGRSGWNVDVGDQPTQDFFRARSFAQRLDDNAILCEGTLDLKLMGGKWQTRPACVLYGDGKLEMTKRLLRGTRRASNVLHLHRSSMHNGTASVDAMDACVVHLRPAVTPRGSLLAPAPDAAVLQAQSLAEMGIRETEEESDEDSDQTDYEEKKDPTKSSLAFIELRATHEASFAEMRTSAEAQLQAVREEEANAAARMSEAHSVELQTIRQAHQSIADRLSASAAEAELRFAAYKRVAMTTSASVREHHLEERSELEAKIGALQDASDEMLAVSTVCASEVQKEFEASMRELEANLSEAKHQALAHVASEHSAELQMLRRKHDSLIKGELATGNKLSEELAGTVKCMRARYAVKYAEAIAAAATEMESFHTAHAEALAGHRASAEHEQSALEAKLLALASDASELNEHRAAHAAELARYQEAAEEARAALEAKLRSEEEKSATKNTAHAAAEDSHASTLVQIAALRASHAEELVAAGASEAASEEKIAALRLAHAEENATRASALDVAAAQYADLEQRFYELQDVGDAQHAAQLKTDVDKSNLEAKVQATLAELEEHRSAAAAQRAIFKQQCDAVQNKHDLVLLKLNAQSSGEDALHALQMQLHTIEDQHAGEQKASAARTLALKEQCIVMEEQQEVLVGQNTSLRLASALQEVQLHEAVATLEAQLERRCIEATALRATHASAMDGVAAELEASKETNAENLISFANVEDLSVHNRELVEEMQRLRALHSEELVRSNGFAAATKASLEDKVAYEESKNAELTEAIRARAGDLSAAAGVHAAEVAALTEASTSEKMQYRGAAKIMQGKMQAAHHDQVEELKRCHAVEHARAVEHAERERAALQARLTAALSEHEATATIRASTLDDAAAELAQLRADVVAVQLDNASLEMKLIAAVETSAARRAAHAAAEDAHSTTLAELELASQRAAAQHDEHVVLLAGHSIDTDALASAAAELEQLRTAHAAQMAEVETLSRSVHASLEASLLAEGEKSAAKHAAHAEAIKAHVATLSELTGARELEASLRKKYDALLASSSEDKCRLEASFSHVSELEKSTAALTLSAASHADEIEEHRVTSAEALRALESNVTASCNALALQTKMESKLEAKIAASSAENVLLSGLLRAATQVQQEAEDRAARAEQDLGSLHAELALACEKSEALQAEQRTELTRQRRSSERSSSLVNAALRATHARELEDAAVELASCRAFHATESDDFRAAAAEDLRELEARLTAAVSTKKEMLAAALHSASVELQQHKDAHAAELEEHRALAIQSRASLEAKLRVNEELKAAKNIDAYAETTLATLSAIRASHSDELAVRSLDESARFDAMEAALSKKLHLEESRSAEHHSAHMAAESAHASTLKMLAASRHCESSMGDAHVAEKRGLEANVETLRAAYTQAIHDAALEREQYTEHAAALVKHRTEAVQTRVGLETEHANELDTVRESAAKVCVALQAEFQEAQRLHAERHTALVAAEDVIAKNLSGLAETHEYYAVELDNADAQLQQANKAHQATLSAEVAALNATHASALTSSAAQLQNFRGAHAEELSRHEGIAEKMKVTLEAKLQRAEERSDAKHAAHVEAVDAHTATLTDLVTSREHTVELERKFAALEAKYTAKTNSLNENTTKTNSLEREAAALRAAHAIASAEAAVELKRCRESHAKEQDDSRSDAAQHLTELEAQFFEAASEGEAVRDLTLAKASAELARHQELAEQRQSSMEARLRAEVETSAAQRAGHSAALAEAAREATTELQRFRREHAAELLRRRGLAEEQHASLEAKLRAEKEDSAAARLAHSVAVEAHFSALNELTSANAREVTLLAAHVVEKKSLSASAAELHAARDAEVSMLKATHERALVDLPRELELCRALHAQEIADHRTGAAAKLQALEAKLMLAASAERMAHRTKLNSDLSDAAVELKMNRAEHALEITKHRGLAEQAEASLEAKLRSEKEKSATKHAALCEALDARAATANALSAARARAAALEQQHSVMCKSLAVERSELSSSRLSLTALEAEAAVLRASHARVLDEARRSAQLLQSEHTAELQRHRFVTKQTEASLGAMVQAARGRSIASHAAYDEVVQAHAATLAQLAAAGDREVALRTEHASLDAERASGAAAEAAAEAEDDETARGVLVVLEGELNKTLATLADERAAHVVEMKTVYDRETALREKQREMAGQVEKMKAELAASKTLQLKDRMEVLEKKSVGVEPLIDVDQTLAVVADAAASGAGAGAGASEEDLPARIVTLEAMLSAAKDRAEHALSDQRAAEDRFEAYARGLEERVARERNVHASALVALGASSSEKYEAVDMRIAALTAALEEENDRNDNESKWSTAENGNAAALMDRLELSPSGWVSRVEHMQLGLSDELNVLVADAEAMNPLSRLSVERGGEESSLSPPPPPLTLMLEGERGGSRSKPNFGETIQLVPPTLQLVSILDAPVPATARIAPPNLRTPPQVHISRRGSITINQRSRTPPTSMPGKDSRGGGADTPAARLVARARALRERAAAGRRG